MHKYTHTYTITHTHTHTIDVTGTKGRRDDGTELTQRWRFLGVQVSGFERFDRRRLLVGIGSRHGMGADLIVRRWIDRTRSVFGIVVGTDVSQGRTEHYSFTYPLCCRFPTKMHALNRSRSSPRCVNHCPLIVVSRLDSSTNTSTATNEMEWHTDGGSIHAGGRNLDILFSLLILAKLTKLF